MTELAKSFEPAEIEAIWGSEWERRRLYRAGQAADKPAFAIQLPPPNVTGTLHMGHAFNQTLMDTLTRWHRMRGDNTLWLPGTDHAGIATQIVVERQLDSQGVSRHDLGREGFVDKVWQWKEHSGSTITGQMRRLGASCDWDLEYFTMDSRCSEVVKEVFVTLYEQGLIYRGKRLVNWDPKLLTAVSDLEVVSEEEEGRLWSLHYPLADGGQGLVVATTRPETMLGDVAVAVHPEDERYRHLVGRMLRLPIADRDIPVIADDHVDPAFGTGCVKITPAHDFNDYAMGQRHGLEMISILTLDGKINDNAPAVYRGMDRFDARKAILADLEKLGLLIDSKPHKLMIPRGDRTQAIIEPMLTDQWFVAMTRPAPEGCPNPGMSIAEKALQVVDSGEVRFVPENWVSTYRHWLDNIQDWCISRQLWWGHQIPAWYKADESGQAIYDGTVFVARSETDARQMAERAGWTGPLVRDPDVLDTWFSSALVPFSTLADPDQVWDREHGRPNLRPELAQFLPSSVLVTGFDIIFFWVARMIMMTCHFTGKVPFHDVYVHALVRDAEGQKMSKSKGNTLDPIDLIDGIGIEELVAKRTSGLMNPRQSDAIAKRTRKEYPSGIPSFGTDALRFTFASLATPGRNINFDLHRCEGYRNFCNKLWNASRFVLMNCEGQDNGLEVCAGDCGPDGALNFTFVDRWIVSRLQRAEAAVDQHLSDYRFDLAAREIYEFVWNEFCDWYLELAKVQIALGKPNEQKAARRTLLRVLEATLRLAHPIIPFITEALWQSVAPAAGRSQRLACGETDSIVTAGFPRSEPAKIDPLAEARVTQLKEIIGAVRALRSEMGLSPGDKVPLRISTESVRTMDRDTMLDPRIDGPERRQIAASLKALARLSEVSFEKTLGDEARRSPVQIVGDLKLMLVVAIDLDAERSRLAKEAAKLESEISRANTKLGNASFVEKAPPEVVEQERIRLRGFESALSRVKEQIAQL